MSDKPDELDIEEAAVRAALRRRLREMKQTAADLADPRPWVQERPWTSCAAAAGAGFAAGWMLGAPAKPKPEASPAQDHHDSGHRSISAMLAASVLPAMQPMLREMMDNAMSAVGFRQAQQWPDSSQTAEVPVPEAMSPGITGDNQVV